MQMSLVKAVQTLTVGTFVFVKNWLYLFNSPPEIYSMNRI